MFTAPFFPTEPLFARCFRMLAPNPKERDILRRSLEFLLATISLRKNKSSRDPLDYFSFFEEVGNMPKKQLNHKNDQYDQYEKTRKIRDENDAENKKQETNGETDLLAKSASIQPLMRPDKFVV